MAASDPAWMRDYRFWWGLFVFFGVTSVLAVQLGFSRWRRFGRLLRAVPRGARDAQLRRFRREGWRLACMVASLITMTALVFAALLGAPAALVLLLRLVAIGSVAAVIVLGLAR
jgi:hypothetical protein